MGWQALRGPAEKWSFLKHDETGCIRDDTLRWVEPCRASAIPHERRHPSEDASFHAVFAYAGITGDRSMPQGVASLSVFPAVSKRFRRSALAGGAAWSKHLVGHAGLFDSLPFVCPREEVWRKWSARGGRPEGPYGYTEKAVRGKWSASMYGAPRGCLSSGTIRGHFRHGRTTRSIHPACPRRP